MVKALNFWSLISVYPDPVLHYSYETLLKYYTYKYVTSKTPPSQSLGNLNKTYSNERLQLILKLKITHDNNNIPPSWILLI